MEPDTHDPANSNPGIQVDKERLRTKAKEVAEDAIKSTAKSFWESLISGFIDPITGFFKGLGDFGIGGELVNSASNIFNQIYSGVANFFNQLIGSPAPATEAASQAQSPTAEPPAAATADPAPTQLEVTSPGPTPSPGKSPSPPLPGRTLE